MDEQDDIETRRAPAPDQPARQDGHRDVTGEYAARPTPHPGPLTDVETGQMRMVPPDRPPVRWWVRHRGKLQTLEWGATVLFLLGALYFLWLLLFTSPPPPPPAPVPPSRQEFSHRLRELPLPAANPSWAIEAKPGRWLGVVIHHTDTDGGSVEAIDRYHREERKWENGFGYHFLIGNGKGLGDGEVAVGHRWLEQDKLDGAHVRTITDARRTELKLPQGVSANASFIGVALVGNFDKSLPTSRQLASLRSLLTFLRSEYGIGLASIVGHGDVMNTRCPGQWFFVDEVILALANP